MQKPPAPLQLSRRSRSAWKRDNSELAALLSVAVHPSVTAAAAAAAAATTRRHIVIATDAMEADIDDADDNGSAEHKAGF